MLCQRTVPPDGIELTARQGGLIQCYLGSRGSNSWMLCLRTVPLAVLSLPLDRSPIQVLPGLQQLDALSPHCSTGGIELTAGQVPYTSITWAPTVGCSACALFHWRYRAYRWTDPLYKYYLGSNSWMLCLRTVPLAVSSLPLDRSPKPPKKELIILMGQIKFTDKGLIFDFFPFS
jgi:hypothetical protein